VSAEASVVDLAPVGAAPTSAAPVVTTRASTRRARAGRTNIKEPAERPAPAVEIESVVPERIVAPERRSVADSAVAPETLPITISVAGAAQGEATSADSVSAEPDVDAFAEASRTFTAVAGSRSTIDVCFAPPEQPAGPTLSSAQDAPSSRMRRRGRLAAVGASVGVMGIAGLIAVSMTFPAEALAAAQGGTPGAAMSLTASSAREGSSIGGDEIQAYVASSELQNDVIQRSDGFSTASLREIATEQGIAYSSSVYTNDPDAAIQWPFMVGVGMSYGYGMRDGTLHEGLDLVPGDGAPVQAIAGGTVRIATESGGNYGVTVYIDHMIDGELITSHYSHMQYGSLQVETGQIVEVGDLVGKVGNTGRSFGAHMHFELIVDGMTIDPLPWMQENAGRYDGVSPVS